MPDRAFLHEFIEEFEMKKINFIVLILSLVISISVMTSCDNTISSLASEEQSAVAQSADYEAILQGDFSAIAGEYSNKKGDTITFLADGSYISSSGDVVAPHKDSWKNKNGDASLYWTYGEGTGSFAGTCFPAGKEIPDVPSDISVDRLGFGHDYPSEEEVYHRN